MKYIDADSLRAEIERMLDELNPKTKMLGDRPLRTINPKTFPCERELEKVLYLIDTLQKEQSEVDLYNNGWIDCSKQMPKETKQWSDTMQGHREWTESDRVLVWDSIYGCGVDATKNGKWMSEQRGGYTGQVVHGIIAWRPIPEFNEELLFNAKKEKRK